MLSTPCSSTRTLDYLCPPPKSTTTTKKQTEKTPTHKNQPNKKTQNQKPTPKPRWLYNHHADGASSSWAGLFSLYPTWTYSRSTRVRLKQLKFRRCLNRASSLGSAIGMRTFSQVRSKYAVEIGTWSPSARFYWRLQWTLVKSNWVWQLPVPTPPERRLAEELVCVSVTQMLWL